MYVHCIILVTVGYVLETDSS